MASLEYRHMFAMFMASLEFVARHGRLPNIVDIAVFQLPSYVFISFDCKDPEPLCEEFVEMLSDVALSHGLATRVRVWRKRYELKFYDIKSSIM